MPGAFTATTRLARSRRPAARRRTHFSKRASRSVRPPAPAHPPIRRHPASSPALRRCHRYGKPLDHRVQRYYDPGTGQFMSLDPLNSLTNSGYTFNKDNPFGYTDPAGTVPCGGGVYCSSSGANSSHDQAAAASGNPSTGTFTSSQSSPTGAAPSQQPAGCNGPSTATPSGVVCMMYVGHAYISNGFQCNWVCQGVAFAAINLLGEEFRVGEYLDALKVVDAIDTAEEAATGARGLSDLGGVIEETGTNGSGGRIFTSTGRIAQKDFAGIVNSALIRGDDVSILSGAHGLANGTWFQTPLSWGTT